MTGVELLKQYREDLRKYETQRQELANAEKLFDLPITVYHELIHVQKEVKGQEHIYTIYEEQKVTTTRKLTYCVLVILCAHI